MQDLTTANTVAATTDAQQARFANAIAARPIETPGGEPAFVIPDGFRLEVLDTERYQTTPNDLRGTGRFHDPAAFAQYVERFSTRGTSIWYDPERGRFEAVLDDAWDAESPDWGRHRAVLELIAHDYWQQWTHICGRPINQRSWANHLDIVAPTMVEPSGSELRELISTMEVTSRASVAGVDQLSHNHRVTFEVGQQVKAGKNLVDFPDVLRIATPVYQHVLTEDGKLWARELEVRLDVNVAESNGKKTVVVTGEIPKAQQAVRDCTNHARQALSAALDFPIWHGTPADRR